MAGGIKTVTTTAGPVITVSITAAAPLTLNCTGAGTGAGTTDTYLLNRTVTNLKTVHLPHDCLPFFEMRQTAAAAAAAAAAASTTATGSGNGYDWSFLFVIVFIAAGCLGNLLVCFAVAFDKRLQNVTNYFLFSLAIADLLVTLVVMPLGAIPGFLGYWPFGLFWCNVYVTCDVLGCSASIMHMCFISFSRYVGIRNPLKSRQSITKRFVIMKIILVWLLSMFISSSITILGIINRENIMPKANQCVINNRIFFVFGSMAAFYIPMTIMIITYVLTVQLLRTKLHLAPLSTHSDQSDQFAPIVRHIGGDNGKQSQSQPQQVTTTLVTTSVQESQKSHDNTETVSNSANSPKRTKVFSFAKFSFTPVFAQKRSTFAPCTLATERKASKVLGIVFFTFVFCWTPFFILNIVLAICPTCSQSIPDLVFSVCLWLGYVSSTINPIIYTIFNATFRQAFFAILTCHWNRLKQPLRYQRSKIEPKTFTRQPQLQPPPKVFVISPSD